MADRHLTTQPDEQRLGRSLASAVGSVWLMGLPTRAGGMTTALVVAYAGFKGYTQTPRDLDVVMSPADARKVAESILEVLDRNGL